MTQKEDTAGTRELKGHGVDQRNGSIRGSSNHVFSGGDARPVLKLPARASLRFRATTFAMAVALVLLWRTVMFFLELL
jgi:hypothetical protein